MSIEQSGRLRRTVQIDLLSLQMSDPRHIGRQYSFHRNKLQLRRYNQRYL